MKLLAFTDLHLDFDSLREIKKNAKDADILVCAGDFTVFGRNTKLILEKINKLGKKVILIPGNHEDEDVVEKECKKLPNILYIHKKAIEINGFLFVGWGGGGFALVDREFEKFTSKFENKKNIILITHAPPYKTKLDLLWEHRGCKSITNFIKKAKVLLAISGHFHENFGEIDYVGKSVLVNPGPDGMIIEI